MEASPAAPSPPPAATPEEGKGGAPARIGAAIGGLILLFIAAVAIIVMVDVADTTPCDDVQTIADLNSDGECYDRSSGVKTLVLIIGSLGSLATIAAAVLAFGYAFRGRGGRLLIQTLIAAVVLLGLTMIIG